MKTRTIILLILGGLVGLILLAIVGLYFSLRSPSVTAAFTPRLQQLIKDSAGIDTQFGSVAIDLLGHIDLKDITAKNDQMDIKVPHMTLDYSAAQLLDGQVVVHSFSLDKPTIAMTLMDDGTPKEEPEPEEPAKPLPQLIRHWLNTPDVFINLKDVAITDADINLKMVAPTGETAVVLNDLSAAVSTHHVPGELRASLSLDLAKDLPQAITMTPAKAQTPPAQGTEGAMELAVKPHAALKADIQLKELAEDRWQLLVNAPELVVDANELRFASMAPEGATRASVDSHSLTGKVIAALTLLSDRGGADEEALTILPGKIDVDLDLAEDGVQVSQPAMALSLKSLAVKLKDTSTDLNTDGLKPLLTGLTNDLMAKVALAGLSFQQKDQKQAKAPSKSQPAPIQLARATLDLGSAIAGGKGDLSLDLKTGPIQGLPGLNAKRKQNPEVTARLDGELDFKTQKFALSVNAADQFANRLVLNERYEPSAVGHPLLTHDVAFNLTEALDRYLPQPVLKGDVGYYSGTLKGTTQVGGSVDLFAIDMNSYAAYPASADLVLNLDQKKPGTSRMLVHRKPITITVTGNYGEGGSSGSGSGSSGARTIDAQLNVAGDSIQLKGLKGSVPLRLAAAFAAPVDITTDPIGLPKATATADVKVGKGLPQAARLDATITNSPKRLGLKANLLGNVSSQLIRLVPPLAKAKLFGSRYYGLWRAKGAWQGTVGHPHSTVLSVTPKDQKRLRLNIDGNLSLSQTARGKLARLKGPVTVGHSIKGSMAKGTAAVKVAVPDAQLTGLTGLRGLKVNSTNSFRLGRDIAKDSDLATTTSVTIAQLRPATKVLPVKGAARFLNKIALDVQGSLADQDRFDLKKLTLTSEASGAAGTKAIDAVVKGSGSLKNLALQATGKLKGNFPEGKIAAVDLKGQATVPFSVTANKESVNKGNKGPRAPGGGTANLALSIKPEFKGFSVTTPDLAIANLSGTFSVDEQIIVHNLPPGTPSSTKGSAKNAAPVKAKFRYIQSRDPFKRVDYGRIEPFLQKENMITADRIQFGKTELGPLRANLAIEQNHLTLPYIATQVLDGWYVGKMFLDFKPSQLKLGYLGRITQINLGKLLPSASGDDGKRFSSRLGLELDINRALLEGKVDVTEIGQTQLLQVLDALDPTREDAKLNQARTALAVGAPSYLGLGFQQGLMDMDIQFEAALVPNINITGVPLTSFIEANLSPFKATLSQLPLE